MQNHKLVLKKQEALYHGSIYKEAYVRKYTA